MLFNFNDTYNILCNSPSGWNVQGLNLHCIISLKNPIYQKQWKNNGIVHNMTQKLEIELKKREREAEWDFGSSLEQTCCMYTCLNTDKHQPL